MTGLIFRDVTPYSLVDTYQRFVEPSSLSLYGCGFRQILPGELSFLFAVHNHLRILFDAVEASSLKYPTIIYPSIASVIISFDLFGNYRSIHGGSQWPRGLRHEMSSLARKLGSLDRIPLMAWMSVCVYSVCVVLCIGSGLATGWSPVQGVLPTVCRIKKLKSGQGPTKGCRAIDR
jgi:hypothetical protein